MAQCDGVREVELPAARANLSEEERVDAGVEGEVEEDVCDAPVSVAGFTFLGCACEVVDSCRR